MLARDAGARCPGFGGAALHSKTPNANLQRPNRTVVEAECAQNPSSPVLA